MEIIDTTFTLNESDLSEGSKKIVTSWYGKNINDLLDYSYDPLTVSSLIDMSIEQKILTPYSGFIILDQDVINNTNEDDNGDGSNKDDTGGNDDNGGEMTGVEDNINNSFSLELSAYPNPFNSIVTLMVTIPDESNYTLIIYNVLGQKIKEIDLSSYSTGIHYVQWFGDTDDNHKVASGLYFAVLHGKNITKTVKLQLLE